MYNYNSSISGSCLPVTCKQVDAIMIGKQDGENYKDETSGGFGLGMGSVGRYV